MAQESVASELEYHLGWVLNPGGMPPPKLSKKAGAAICAQLESMGINQPDPFAYFMDEFNIDARRFPKLLSDTIKGLK